MSVLSIDFETRSAQNLRKVGVYRYASDPSTEIMCMAWSFDNAKPELWVMGQKLPRAVREHVESGGEIHAWNAMFERLIWRQVGYRRLGWPRARNRQFVCTMARAQACGLPASLEHAAIALKLPERKDTIGGKAMLKLSKPRAILYNGKRLKKGEAPPPGVEPRIVWWEGEELFEQMHVYCRQDVVTEMAAARRIPMLSQREQELYWLDQQMNDVGFKLDIVLCKRALVIMSEAKRILTNRCKAICGIAPSQTMLLRKWINENGAPDLETLSRDVIKAYVEKKKLPKNVRRVIDLRFQAAKLSSAAKYQKALDAVCEDGRLHGMMRFLGAGATGRWSSQIVQLQNMTRPKLKGVDCKELILHTNFHGLELLTGQPMQVITDAIRSMLICEEDEELFSADLKNIESRVIAEQAGQESILQTWRRFDAGKGPDLYVIEAAKLFQLKPERITEEQRFWGKQEVLSLGFEGGPGALIRMVEKAGGNIADLYPFLWKRATERRRWRAMQSFLFRGQTFEKKQWLAAWFIVDTFRTNNPKIVEYWRLLEDASVAAVVHKGRTTRARKIKFLADDDWLWITLPSGRRLAYAEPRVELETLHGKQKLTLRAHYVDDRRKWREFAPYGGHISENTTQGDARDVMAYRLPDLKKRSFMPLLTVHDETVCKATRDTKKLKEYISIISQPPSWAPSLPVAAEGWTGRHYRK